MGTASVRDTPRRASHLRLLYLEIRRRPLLALAGGALLIAVGAGLVAATIAVLLDRARARTARLKPLTEGA